MRWVVLCKRLLQAPVCQQVSLGSRGVYSGYDSSRTSDDDLIVGLD